MARNDLPRAVTDALAKADAPALQALALSADRGLKKAAKRALHLLRAKGAVIAEPAREASATAPRPGPAVPEEPLEPVRVTAFDGAGERAFFIPIKASPGFTLHVAILSDGGQLLNLQAHALSRRQLKSYLTALPEETLADLRELSTARAVTLLAPALESAEGPLRPSARALLAQLALGERAPEPPPPAVDAGRVAESAELFQTSLFARALPEREAILDLSHKLEEVAVSPLYVDEAQRLAQLRHTVERVVSSYFTPDRRQRFAARASDAAEIYEARGESDDAERARALAVALRGDRDVLGIPFARAFFERILNLEAASKLGPAREEAASPPIAQGLIVPP